MSPRLEFLEKFLANNFALLDAEDRRFILLVQMKKKWFLWVMAAAQDPENHGDEWGLTCRVDSTLQKWFVSFPNKNNRKTDLKSCTPWLVDEENTSDLHLVLENFHKYELH